MALIEKDSALRRVPKAIGTRVVLYLDGVRYSIEILDVAFHRVEATLKKISDGKVESDDLGLNIVSAISDAWTVVDSAHRLRELIQQLPGLKKSTPEVQIFLRNTEKIENLRNFFQHFRTEINSFVERKMALYGTLSWSCINQESKLPESHTIVPGTFFHEIRAEGCVFDSHEGRFVDRIILCAGDERVDLAKIYDRVASFSNWFEKTVTGSWAGHETHGADMHLLMALEPVRIETTNETK